MTSSSSTDNKVLSEIAETLVQKPSTIRIKIVSPTIKEKLLIRLKKMSRYREFEVRPLTYGKLIQISKILLSVDMSAYDNENPQRSFHNLMSKFESSYAEVLTIALTPGRKPSHNIRQFLLNNLTPKEGMALSSLILDKMDISSFLLTIGTLQGLKTLRGPRPITVPGDLLVE